ncbi:MAG: FAD binding domain-containing protein, partial [Solirubrobacterales bacterium]
EACARLSAAARPAAGCTAVPLAEAAADPQVQELVDLAGLGELRGVTVHGDRARIGAMTTLGELEGRAEVRAQLPMLSAAAAGVADEVLRRVATIGGNIAPRVQRQLELPAVLVALGAELELAGGGRDRVSADALCDRDFELAPEELIVAIHAPAQDGPWAYRKLTTNLDSYGIANLAIAGTADGRWSVAASLGESIPQRLVRAEEALGAGDSSDPEVIASEATSDLEAVDDALGSAAYRRRAVAAALEGELRRLSGGQAGA